uniref:Ubiquitin like 4A n=2 Tax=Cercopithecinae TaxID=9528 RepID=A0A7N9DG94_MACFA
MPHCRMPQRSAPAARGGLASRATPTAAEEEEPIDLSLADGKRLSDYSIGPNSKLNLVVKPLQKVLLEEGEAQRLADSPPPHVWQLISKVLARHFSAADASRVLEQLQRDYERSLSRLTLDDIERLASRFLHPEVTETMEKGFSK